MDNNEVGSVKDKIDSSKDFFFITPSACGCGHMRVIFCHVTAESRMYKIQVNDQLNLLKVWPQQVGHAIFHSIQGHY